MYNDIIKLKYKVYVWFFLGNPVYHALLELLRQPVLTSQLVNGRQGIMEIITTRIHACINNHFSKIPNKNSQSYIVFKDQRELRK